MNWTLALLCTRLKSFHWENQGTLIEGDGEVQLTSSLRELVFVKKKMIFAISKAPDPNKLVKEVNCTKSSPSVRVPWIITIA